VDTKMMQEQFARIEIITAKCVDLNEYKRICMPKSEGVFREAVEHIIDTYDKQTFPRPAIFAEAISVVLQRRNDTNQKTVTDRIVSKNQIHATKEEVEECMDFRRFLNEVRTWYEYDVPINFDGNWGKLTPLSWRDWQSTLIIADIGDWIAAGRPPLPCPIIRFAVQNAERFYKHAAANKSTITKYWDDMTEVLKNTRIERRPESAGKTATQNEIVEQVIEEAQK